VVLQAPPRADPATLRAAGTRLLDQRSELAQAIVDHVRREMPEFERFDGEFESGFRRALESQLEEMASLLRAQLPPVAVSPLGLRDYGEAMRRHGVVLASLAGAYGLAFEVTRAVIGTELDEFTDQYLDRVLAGLADVYEAEEPDAAIGAAPATDAAARVALGIRVSDEHTAERARARCQAVLDRFRGLVETAAGQPNLSRRLARAGTVAAFRLADEPELAVTLLLDREPVEVLDGAHEAECELEIASIDLARLWSEELLLPMAIAGGRVGVRGAVRKLLLVWPILDELAHDAVEGPGTTARPDEIPVDETEPARGFSAEQRLLLDRAADYSLHEGALEVAQNHPGDFWSIECVDVYKRFESNQVLNGLNLGIPEGMITVVLGPSGTGKSVLINHLIGLMYPDAGDILVHGRSVTGMRRRELLEMRRKFGILFQDGALFGSMPIYDNVAFPLRQHTSFSEREIREIVMARLEEVGLAKAAALMPSELSGGMRKRAGFARALVLEPEVVMFDEPDSGLDPVRTALLCRLIRRVHREHGGTYIVVTHDIASMRAIGEYIAVLWKGRIVQAGDREQMLHSDNPFVRQFLTGADVGPLGME
jgi:phospholipid/cholesterol/gamma-HCH transport system ATP-binding protein